MQKRTRTVRWTGWAGAMLGLALVLAPAGQAAPPPTPVANDQVESAAEAVAIVPAAPSAGSANGYASAASVPQGGSLDLHVSSSAASYSLRVTRASGSGWTLMTTISNLPGIYYDCNDVGVPAGQENVQLGCNWPVAYSLSIPSNWSSGLYAVQILTAGQAVGGSGNYILFVVTAANPGSAAHILVLMPTTPGRPTTSPAAGAFTPARRVTLRPPAASRSTGRWPSATPITAAPVTPRMTRCWCTGWRARAT